MMREEVGGFCLVGFLEGESEKELGERERKKKRKINMDLRG